MQPDFADLPIGQFGGGLGVDDGRTLVDTDPAGGGLRDGARCVGGHLDEPPVVQRLPVDVNDRGRLVHRGGRDEQGGLGQTVGRFNRRLLEAERRKRLVELAYRCRRHRLAAVEDRLDITQVQRWLTLFGHATQRGVFEGEVRRGGDGLAGVTFLARELANPPAGPAHEGGGRHEGEAVADDRRQQGGDQAHVMEERQPAHTAVAFRALHGIYHLDHVGGQVQMRDLDARRGAGGAGGVLQIGDGVVAGRHGLPGGGDLGGHRVDGDDAWPLLGRPAAEELADPLGGVAGGQDRRRGAVVEHRVQPADVTRLGRVE